MNFTHLFVDLSWHTPSLISASVGKAPLWYIAGNMLQKYEDHLKFNTNTVKTKLRQNLYLAAYEGRDILR